jgi:hypothetical protein
VWRALDDPEALVPPRPGAQARRIELADAIRATLEGGQDGVELTFQRAAS